MSESISIQQMHLLRQPNPYSITTFSPFKTTRHLHLHLHRQTSFPSHSTLLHNNPISASISKTPPQQVKEPEKKSFWAAISLIIGTAVGPGMLALPSSTILSGPLPSTLSILLSWLYVIASIILVAELSFASMHHHSLSEVSFTSLATTAFGFHFGTFVSLVYASLSFCLLIACVSGIGSIVSQWFPFLNNVLAHALFPLSVCIVMCSLSFNAIDGLNRFLCFLMLFSITSLVVIGLSVARTNLIASFAHASWRLSSVLPAIPVTVLTLGFHVVTPFICKLAGNTVSDARKAILIGGSVPLFMVLSWNLIVLGLVGDTSKINTAVSSQDPISLLLSVSNSSTALFAVQAFAFSALGTSLIGYAVSFPQQILDTLELIFGKTKQSRMGFTKVGNGRVGFVGYPGGNAGAVSFVNTARSTVSKSEKESSSSFGSYKLFVTVIILCVPIFIASFFRSTFARALDFAGVYANCFLFGILPPAMAFVYQSRKKLRSFVLPGGDAALLLLFVIAVILGIWH